MVPSLAIPSAVRQSSGACAVTIQDQRELAILIEDAIVRALQRVNAEAGAKVRTWTDGQSEITVSPTADPPPDAAKADPPSPRSHRKSKT